MRLPALVAVAVLAASVAAGAATPSPQPSAPPRVNVEKLQPKSIFPKRALHVEVVVEVNKYGQVARVKSILPSHDQQFDAHIYGNALQAFIRTPDGQVLVGTYKLVYDYDPKTQRIRRDVALLKAGGVNPDAKGAATDMMEIARRNRDRTPPPGLFITPAPAPSPTGHRIMPDLPQVMQSPSPQPH
jgi:hypothetical protein